MMSAYLAAFSRRIDLHLFHIFTPFVQHKYLSGPAGLSLQPASSLQVSKRHSSAFATLAWV